MATTTRQQAGQVRWARLEVVPGGPAAEEAPLVVVVSQFRVEVSGDFSPETLAAVLDVPEGQGQ